VIISRIKAAQKLPGVALEPGPAFLKGLFVNPGARRLPGTPGILTALQASPLNLGYSLAQGS